MSTAAKHVYCDQISRDKQFGLILKKLFKTNQFKILL